jgi:hypothetical protein
MLVYDGIINLAIGYIEEREGESERPGGLLGSLNDCATKNPKVCHRSLHGTGAIKKDDHLQC